MRYNPFRYPGYVSRQRMLVTVLLCTFQLELDRKNMEITLFGQTPLNQKNLRYESSRHRMPLKMATSDDKCNRHQTLQLLSRALEDFFTSIPYILDVSFRPLEILNSHFAHRFPRRSNSLLSGLIMPSLLRRGTMPVSTAYDCANRGKPR